MQLKVKAEGGDGHPAVRMKLCGDPIEIRYAEKHLIDLQEMVRGVQGRRDTDNAGDIEIPLKLGELETSLRFVETHRQDIKTILH